MLQGCVAALRQQLWPTFVGGASFKVAVRTARRKHLRISVRAKKTAANKAKKEVEKEQPFVPYKLRMLQASKPKIRTDLKTAIWLKSLPVDDVWVSRYYLKRICTIPEALSFHREVFHPSVLDSPEALVHLDLELNMRLEKDTKFLDNIKSIVHLPFRSDEERTVRSVVAICKNPEDQERALKAGADVAGHLNIINAIEKGELKMDTVDYIVCHVDSVMDTLKLRGLLKKKMPDKKKGTLGSDIIGMVTMFAKGVEYVSTKDPGVNLFGSLKFTIGRLDMTNDQIDANMTTFMKSLTAHRPLDFGPFVNKARMVVDGSRESFLLDLTSYVPKPTAAAPSTKKGKTASSETKSTTEIKVEKDSSGDPVKEKTKASL